METLTDDMIEALLGHAEIRDMVAEGLRAQGVDPAHGAVSREAEAAILRSLVASGAVVLGPGRRLSAEEFLEILEAEEAAEGREGGDRGDAP